ncbi:hypothetical protein [Paraburkholderia aromaticivorans]|nr:hypothetical protein [Paraburkholderia aromaticivorans]
MKKLVYAALCAATLFSGANYSYAQSSVTLYGVVDDSLRLR